MAEWTKIIWVCYLLFGWSGHTSMPASFFPLSLYLYPLTILFSFKHTYMLYTTCMSMSVNPHGTCQCIMNFNFSFLKETLYADISVIECSLKDILSVKCWCNIFFFQFLVGFSFKSNNLGCQIFFSVSWSLKGIQMFMLCWFIELGIEHSISLGYLEEVMCLINEVRADIINEVYCMQSSPASAWLKLRSC